MPAGCPQGDRSADSRYAAEQALCNQAEWILHTGYEKHIIQGRISVTHLPMTLTLIGYTGCLSDEQDVAAQKALEALGVFHDRIRLGLEPACAAVCTGDTFVVPRLERLARSVPDARFIADALVARGASGALLARASMTLSMQSGRCSSTFSPRSPSSRPT